jgi:hypothetical protein
VLFIRLKEAAKTKRLAQAVLMFLKVPKIGTFGMWGGGFFVKMKF